MDPHNSATSDVVLVARMAQGDLGAELWGSIDRPPWRSEEHTSELQSLRHLVCRLLLEQTNRTVLASDRRTSQRSLPPLPRPPSTTLFPYTTLFRSPEPQIARLPRTTKEAGRWTPTTPRRLMLSLWRAWRRATSAQSCGGPSTGLLGDRKSTRLNSSHLGISYAVFCLNKQTELYSRPIAAPRSVAYHRSPAPPALPSFPTRRSSDLLSPRSPVFQGQPRRPVDGPPQLRDV